MSQSTRSENVLRIGTIFPARTGEGTVRTSTTDIIGEAARMGAILADTRVGDAASRAGLDVEVLLANAPTAAAAERAAERMVALENISVLIGGVGDGQASAIAAIASTAGLPFFNVGSTSTLLRRTYSGGPVFHVEASAAMYLDAIAMWGAKQGWERWFIVDVASGNDGLAARARTAIERYAPDAVVAGTALVQHGQPVYINELNSALNAEADVVLMLVDGADQIAFAGQAESMRASVPLMGFPDPLTQTRDFMVASQYLAPATSPQHRVALWDTALDGEAESFNEAFTGRWGQPADPTSWATYHAVRIAFGAAVSAGSTRPSDVLGELLTERDYNVGKGPGVSFRPWDQQLRQPLYVVQVDPARAWDPLSLASRIDYGEPVATLPADVPPEASDARAALDTLGDGP